MSMYCITCGHEIHSRTAIKHMEKCFNKYEAQSSFGSVFKTRIEGNNMFCDFYNPANRTYCKRLKVLCPEHCKEPKISDTDVCGCPLVQNLFAPTGNTNTNTKLIWKFTSLFVFFLERYRRILSSSTQILFEASRMGEDQKSRSRHGKSQTMAENR